MKIVTQQRQVPWMHVVIVLFPWFGTAMRESISNAGITFTLSKFTDSPFLIGMIGSSNQAFGFLVGATCCFASDRIWTPLGRRRPFLLVGCFVSAALCLFIPLASGLWVAIGLILAYQFFVDFSTPFEAFTMEVIPSKQRGRAGAITSIYKSLAFCLVFAGLIGGFDKVYDLSERLSVSGEHVMYWVNVLVLLVMGGVILFFTKEVKPKGATICKLRDVPFRSIITELCRPEIAPLLGLGFVMQNLWIGLGQFEPLLVTEQWGYSKSQYGNIMAISMAISVIAAPLGGIVSDKFDRLKILRIGLVGVLALKFGYYLYAEYIAPNGIPPYYMVVVLGLLKGAVGSFMTIACFPLIFDFVSKNRFGTLACGFGIVFSLVAFVGVNAMGGWIELSSRYLYKLEDGTYNYMAGYHWIFLLGVLGVAYLFVFSRMVESGRMEKYTEMK